MLPIKEENKLFSKFLTKESSITNPSFRVYYGGNSVNVPFVWEAKPGTPKHTKHINFNSNDKENKDYLPPLTPPPSYNLKQPQKMPSKRSYSKNFLGVFPKSMHRRNHSLSSSSTLSSSSASISVSESTMRSSEKSSSSSSSSSSRSNLSLSSSSSHRRRSLSLSNPGSLFDFLVSGQEDDEQEDVKSPRSILCFGIVGSRRVRSCSIVDH